MFDFLEILKLPFIGINEGATMEAIIAAIGWQAHTVRGAMSGALGKKLGLTVTSAKEEGKSRVPDQPGSNLMPRFMVIGSVLQVGPQQPDPTGKHRWL
jgi:hypothetical protein